MDLLKDGIINCSSQYCKYIWRESEVRFQKMWRYNFMNSGENVTSRIFMDVLCHVRLKIRWGYLRHRYRKQQYLSKYRNTVKCLHNTVQCNKILHTSLQELRQNINQMLNTHKTRHTSPWWASYGVSVVKSFDKIDHAIMALHCSK